MHPFILPERHRLSGEWPAQGYTPYRWSGLPRVTHQASRNVTSAAFIISHFVNSGSDINIGTQYFCYFGFSERFHIAQAGFKFTM